ncbi:outer membrane beta-barrel protein [Shewanella yunxiaonensis]|uniref:Outer membrane beta-barrel protein n=1 Tax=Shewanella yunxiaonensis TaxID=2829809 RepID=A0ABX7YVH5_9GAMM|nr:outer membrane beta-barrel protein [Shewanella yunxiaonensis]QUN06717.1 outer membrane beta-barrel protein [Shewanella yunxiaonensis]
MAQSVAYAEESTTATKSTEDATNQSSRERDRILLKRNPIASEYQTMGPPGDFYGATSDAEGVDFRSQFSLPTGPKEASSIRVEGNLNYQDIAEDVVPGGSLDLAKSFGPLSLQFQVQQNASKRIVDLYQARWLAVSEPALSDKDTMLLGFPRYSRDTFDTTSLDMRWRADYTLQDNVRLTYEGMSTNYDDTSTRDRLEFQNGVGSVSDAVLGSDGSTISEASIASSQLRRYFHQTQTARDINRHRLDLSIDGENGSTEVGMYYSHWVNRVLWQPWNFIDKNVSSSYNIDNRYLPESIAGNIDLYDVSNSVFANYRPSLTTTTDTDYAFIVDWDRKLTLADKVVWVGAGVDWRNKKRNNVNETLVYNATSDSFNLQDVIGNNGAISIMNGDYLLPTALDYAQSQAYFQANQSSQFALDLEQSFLQSIQNLYTSEETVGSAYVNAYQQLNNWFWRMGLRVERTKTNTRGAVSGPPEMDITSEGEAITSLTLNGETVAETFDSFDAAFVEGENSYQHVLPSLELRYKVNADLKLKMAYFEQLMRPQYYDTVRYRRINQPTREISEGSPDLEATSIRNVYAGLEYQYADEGQLVAGVYYNEVSNFFYDSVTTEALDGIVYDVTRVENGKDGYIRGLQAFWSYGFDFPVVASADVQLSYVYSDSEANLGDRTIVMPERAKHRLALNLLLADEKWQYASQFSWQSKAVDDVGQSAAQDTIREAVLVWNQSFTWHFDQQWSTRLALNNVLNTPDRSYQGEESRVVNNLYSGTTARLSVIFNY